MKLDELVCKAEDHAPEDWGEFALKIVDPDGNKLNVTAEFFDIVKGEILLMVDWK